MVKDLSHQVENVNHVVLMNKLLTPYVYVNQEISLSMVFVMPVYKEQPLIKVVNHVYQFVME